MAHGHLKGSYSTKVTPQSEPIPGSNQVRNNAGGFAFEISSLDQLKRFLILGTEGGTYYVGESKLTKQNAKNVIACLDSDWKSTIDLIVQISEEGRAPKNDYAIFALSLAASHSNPECRSYALANLHRVCRIGTHLFHFVDFIEDGRGWGRGLRRAVSRWYTMKKPETLSFQLSKYQSRDGWAHKDLIRLSHPKPTSEEQAELFKWAVGKEFDRDKLIGLTNTFERIKACKTENEVIAVMKENKTQREIIPTEYLNSKKVWELLYPDMGLTALVRNLNKLTQIGIISQGNFSDIKNVVSRLTNDEEIKISRIHPLQVLFALKTYQQGRGFKGSMSWNPNHTISSALNTMFYKAFSNVEPTEKRFYLALDVSGSMSSYINNSFLSCREATAALAMVTLKTEPYTIIKGFCSKLVDLGINESMDLDRVTKKISRLPFGSTDCSQPMLDAINNNYEVDCFIIYTDNETWAGRIHPIQALKMYRQKSGIDAKMIVVGMTSTRFSIADPSDRGSLDIVGFDSSIPTLINDFVSNKF